jgi:hypothetical protein
MQWQRRLVDGRLLEEAAEEEEAEERGGACWSKKEADLWGPLQPRMKALRMETLAAHDASLCWWLALGRPGGQQLIR